MWMAENQVFLFCHLQQVKPQEFHSGLSENCLVDFCTTKLLHQIVMHFVTTFSQPKNLSWLSHHNSSLTVQTKMGLTSVCYRFNNDYMSVGMTI